LTRSARALRGQQAHRHRRSVHGEQGAGRRLLDLAGRIDAGSHRVAEEGALRWRHRSRDSPDLRDRGLRRGDDAGAARKGRTAAQGTRAAASLAGRRKKEEGRREKGEGRREKGEGRREKGEGRREKGEGRREKGEGRREKGEDSRPFPLLPSPFYPEGRLTPHLSPSFPATHSSSVPASAASSEALKTAILAAAKSSGVA